MSGRPVDLASIGQPTNDAERIAYAEALLAQQKFAEASEQMNTVIGNCTDARQAFAAADMSLLIHDLDSADAAYRKAGAVGGSEERAKRGLAAVAKAREGARQDLTLAKDLATKKQLASAVDRYRSAAYQNPRLPEAHVGLADALRKLFPNNPSSLREAALHYQSYINLDRGLPEKEKEKYQKLSGKVQG